MVFMSCKQRTKVCGLRAVLAYDQPVPCRHMINPSRHLTNKTRDIGQGRWEVKEVGYRSGPKRWGYRSWPKSKTVQRIHAYNVSRGSMVDPYHYRTVIRDIKSWPTWPVEHMINPSRADIWSTRPDIWPTRPETSDKVDGRSKRWDTVVDQRGGDTVVDQRARIVGRSEDRISLYTKMYRGSSRGKMPKLGKTNGNHQRPTKVKHWCSTTMMPKVS